MGISKVGKVVIFGGIYKIIYQKISDLKNSINRLLIGGSDLNYKTDQCDSI